MDQKERSQTLHEARDYILVVDDDVATRHALRALLEYEGYEVDAVGDGLEALDRIEQSVTSGHPYSLVIMDLRLEGLSGLEVLRRGKALCASMQSIIITGYANVESAIAALREGAQDYLLKPYHLEQFQVAVKRTLAARKEAVRNTQLLEQARRRVNELAIINSVGQTVTRSLNLNQVLTLVMEQIREALQAEAGSIALLEGGKLVFKVAFGPAAEQVKSFTLEPGQGIVGWCVQENKPALVSNARADSRHFGGIDQKTAFVTKAIICVPMVAEGRVIGAIEAINRLGGTSFDERDLELLQALSVPASVAVENARLHQSLEQRAEELRQALEELKELDRLKSQFVQNISHELRTPLTFIKGYAELLLTGTLGYLTGEQKEGLKLVAGQAEVLTRLVNDVILMQEYELDASQISEVSLREVISLVVAAAREIEAPNKPAIQEYLPDDKCLVRGNQAHLSKVFSNLLDNAIKFSPDGGTVTVSLLSNGDMWEIQVTDTGIGIPEQHLDKIFRRFYQVDGSTTRRFGGAGLGLSIAKEIVEAHNGYIWVKSKEGVGSTFGVCLPKSAGAARPDSSGKKEAK